MDEGDVESYVLSIVEDPETKNLLFLGTDDGLYYSTNAGGQWTKMDPKVFPTVSTKDLVIHPREHDLVIGTFGRAAWVLDDIRPLRALAQQKEIAKNPHHLFEPPVAYQAAYQQPTGSRFGADAMYHGENRKYGAMFTYFYNATEEKGKNKDSLSLQIFDGERLIRTLKRKAPKETGLHRWYWNMDEKGVNRPRRKTIKSKRESAGVGVLPGTYTAVLSSAAVSNVVEIEVKVDPRINPSLDGLEKQYTVSKKLEALTDLAAKVVAQLVESKATLKDYKQRIESQDSIAYKKTIDKCKASMKEITQLVDLFLGKEDKRQGIVRNPAQTVMTRISTARRYVYSRPEGITGTEEVLMQHASTATNDAVKKVNDFYKNNWEALQQEIESIELTAFKAVEYFDLEK